MKKTYDLSGTIRSVSRVTGELMVTILLKDGTYVNMAVGDLPFNQEALHESIGKKISVRVEAEIHDISAVARAMEEA